MDHALDLWPPRQPLGQQQRRGLMPLEPDAKRPQAAQAEIDILWTRTKPEILVRPPHRRRCLFRRGDGAEHGVGMADDIFGGGLDRDIDPVGERLEEQRRRPGIVHDDHGAGLMRGFGDRWDVLHLEALRAGRLGEHHLGPVAEQILDRRADQRVVINGSDAEPPQHVIAEAPRRLIDAVGDEHLVAARDESEQRGGDGRQA